MTLLDPAQGYKPLDFGGGGIAGSIDMNGRIIALNMYHPEHGFVTLTSAEPFREEDRYDPEKVRAYRKSLVNLDGFGFHFDEEIVKREARLLEDAIPKIRLEFANGGSAEVTTFVADGEVIQRWNFDGVTPRWAGRFGLQRCAYTQLTEGGVIPPPPLEMKVERQEGGLLVENSSLSMAVAIQTLPHATNWSIQINGMGEAQSEPLPDETVIAYRFITTSDALPHSPNANEAFQARQKQAENTWRECARGLPTDSILRRALVYGRMMAVSTGSGICLLTDHMLLPLFWTRDGYFVARMLLSSAVPDAANIVAENLRWMFEVAERPEGYWGRAYMANGRVKDPVFQLDQQLHPLLQLAEYKLETPADDGLYDDLRPQISPIIDMLLQRKAGDAMLITTEETPADDRAPHPYHLSSHILMWRTLMKLNQITGEYAAMAEQVRAAINEHFVAEHNGRKIYAYATDGAGNFHFYHDANDFPLALAPAWGFCAADDPVWRATIEFAFSPDNVGGYYEGRLGSVHTPAAWALGDVQELIIARAIGDKDRENRAREYLQKAAQWDGALPEAYDAKTGEVVSRHWFAWPNAAYACFELGAFDS